MPTGDCNNSGTLAGMCGTGYSNAASGFYNNTGYATNGNNDTAEFFDAPGTNTFYAYGAYSNSGQPLAGMYGTGYSNSAKGFSENVAYAINGNNDTAEFFDAPGSNTFYAYGDYNNSGQPVAGMYGTGYSNAASGFGNNVGYAINGNNDTADLFGSSASNSNNALATDLAIANFMAATIRRRHGTSRTSTPSPRAAIIPRAKAP